MRSGGGFYKTRYYPHAAVVDFFKACNYPPPEAGDNT